MQNRAAVLVGSSTLDLDHARREQPLDDAHRLDEPLALGVAQRGQERGGELVALAIQQLALGAAGVGEPHRPHPLVGRARLDHDEPILLERAHQPAEIAGVEVQPRAQDAQVRAVGADLPQHPRRPERPPARQVPVLQRADPLGHAAVERPNLPRRRLVHISDFSQRINESQVSGCGSRPADGRGRGCRRRCRSRSPAGAGR